MLDSEYWAFAFSSFSPLFCQEGRLRALLLSLEGRKPRGRRAACGKQRVSLHMFNVSQAMAAMLVSDPLEGHLPDSWR